MFGLTRDAAAARIELAGSLTIYQVSDARAALLEALATAPAREWLISLARVDELDTAGVQLLLSAQRYLAPSGGNLQVVDAVQAVHELFDLLRVTQLYSDVPAARH